MCMNKEMTLAFTISALIMSAWVISGQGIWNTDRWRRLRISALFWYFAIMEFLQVVQYLTIDDCDSWINQLFTALGWVHITFQPLVSNISFSALDKKNLKKERDWLWQYVFKFCIVAGLLGSARIVIPQFLNPEKYGLDMCTEEVEGVCGPVMCSTTGLFHVKWRFWMLSPMYGFPGVGLHCFNMFIVPALLGLAPASFLLFMTGPVLSCAFRGTDDGERSAVWCFFSIMEATISMGTQYLAVRAATRKSIKHAQ